MTKRPPKQWLTITETAGKLAITVEELLALAQAGEIRYAVAGERPLTVFNVCFKQIDIDKFKEGFTVSDFAERLGVPAIQVREAIEDGDVSVTLSDFDRYAKPATRILRGDFERAAAAFRRWQKRNAA